MNERSRWETPSKGALQNARYAIDDRNDFLKTVKNLVGHVVFWPARGVHDHCVAIFTFDALEYLAYRKSGRA